MMKLSRYAFQGLAVIGGLAACSKITKVVEPAYKDLAQVPNDIVNDASGESPDPGTGSSRAPCAVWLSLPAPAAGAPEFRILEEYKVQIGKGSGGGKLFQMVGRHNLSHLPQLRYALSTEYNGGKSPLDPPDIEAFMALAAEKRARGELSSTEYFMLRTLYQASKISGAAKDKLLDTRNGAVMDAVEAKLPGIFRGRLGSLDGDALILDLKHSSGLPDVLDPVQMDRLQLLTRSVNLFPSADWDERRLDLKASLSALADTASRTDLPLDDRICRFALAQRVTAQILSLKGLHGTPSLQSNGLLEEIPQEDKTEFPKREEVGAYGVVADEAWIQAQLEHTTARLEGAASSSGFLASFRYLVALSAHRDPVLWQLPGAPEASVGTLRLNANLLKMAFGFFGMSGHLFSEEELQMDAQQRLSLREDSADNVADLGSLSMEVVDSFSSLEAPNELELQLLTPEQIHNFTDPYPVGVVPSFEMLMNGVVFEGLARVSEERASEKLKNVLRQIGWRLGNDRLKNLP